MTVLRRRTQLAAAAALAATAIAAPSALAGTYDVQACAAAGGVNRSWTLERTSAAMKITDYCAGGPQDGDFFTTFTPALGIRTERGQPDAPLGTGAYIRFDAPAPLSISGFKVSPHLHTESDSWRVVVETNNNEITHCQNNEPGAGTNDHCEIGKRGGAAPGPGEAIAPAQWFRIGARCVLVPCDMGVTAHAAAAALFSASMTITDPVAPAAAIAGVPAEVTVGGTASATVSASDQTGIRRLELLVDGQLVAASDQACDYTLVLPCRTPGASVAAALTSGPLGYGTHQVVARGIDAAGNVGTSAPATVTVPGPPPRPGPTPTPTPAPATPGPTPGPGATPGPGDPTPTPGATRRPSALKVSTVKRSGSRVRVRGTIATGCQSRIKIAVKARGKTRTVRITAPRSGRWGTTITGVRRGGKAIVKVSASSSKLCLPATRSRHA